MELTTTSPSHTTQEKRSKALSGYDLLVNEQLANAKLRGMSTKWLCFTPAGRKTLNDRWGGLPSADKDLLNVEAVLAVQDIPGSGTAPVISSDASSEHPSIARELVVVACPVGQSGFHVVGTGLAFCFNVVRKKIEHETTKHEKSQTNKEETYD